VTLSKNKRIFITGTGTDIGKTYVSASLLKIATDLKIESHYHKPIQCGKDESTNPPESDAEKVARLTGNSNVSTGVFLETPASPHLAFKKENKSFNLDQTILLASKISSQQEFTIIEGAGGIKVPIDDTTDMLSLCEELQKEIENFEVLVVSSPLLGTLNHTLLTIDALKQKNISIAGFCFSRSQETFEPLELEIFLDSAVQIENRTGVNFYGMLPYLNNNTEYSEWNSHPLRQLLK
jgi:dethiobiotin synthetase